MKKPSLYEFCSYFFSPTLFIKKFAIYAFMYLATPRGFWNFSSLTKDWTLATAVKAESPNPWTTREFPGAYNL